VRKSHHDGVGVVHAWVGVNHNTVHVISSSNKYLRNSASAA
jgi:hypothetical protein